MSDGTVKKVIEFDPECGLCVCDPHDMDEKEREYWLHCPRSPDVVLDLPVKLFEDFEAARLAVGATSKAINDFAEALGYYTEGSWGGTLAKMEDLPPERRQEIRYRKFCDRHHEEHQVYADSKEYPVTVENWALRFHEHEWFDTVVNEDL